MYGLDVMEVMTMSGHPLIINKIDNSTSMVFQLLVEMNLVSVSVANCKLCFKGPKKIISAYIQN